MDLREILLEVASLALTANYVEAEDDQSLCED